MQHLESTEIMYTLYPLKHKIVHWYMWVDDIIGLFNNNENTPDGVLLNIILHLILINTNAIN